MPSEAPMLRLIDDRAVLALPANLGVGESQGLRLACLEAVQTGLPVLIDAEQSERVHSAALQCLLALVLRSEEDGIDLEWTGVSATLQQQTAQLGLAQWLGLAPEEA